MTRIHDEQYHAPYVLSHQLETIAVHAGAAIDPETGAIVPPIHLSTTFEHAADAKDTHGYLYIREGNPTQARLEAALSALEAGEEALVFASGIAAGAALIHAVGPGAHIILPDDMYVTVRTLIRDLLAEWGAQSTDVDMQDLAMVERAFQTNTRLLWVETPSNPLMKVIDISALTTLAHDHGVPVVVDNTIGTPILQRPLKIGS